MSGARERIPAPLLKKRLPSGRGAMLQPNATGDGEARLTPRLWALVVVTGVASGLAGVLMMLLLFTVQQAAFGVGVENAGFSAAVAAANGWHRALPLLVGGVIAGVGWYLLRRFTAGGSSEPDEILWTGRGRLSFRRSAGSAVLSEVVVGLGASLGREAAPKLLGAVSGSLLAEWCRLSPAQRRLLVACGGGSGLAAVYNVPLGGALFTAEVLLGSMNLPVILPALACSGVATVTAYVYLPREPTYVRVPEYAFDVRLLVWALLAGPVIGVLAAAYVRLVGWVSHHQARGRVLLVAPLLAFALLAVIALAYPQLYGNGRGMARDAFVGVGSLGTLASLAVLKPLVTALCLGAGASGGLFTPVMSTGAVLGGAFGVLWSDLWPGSPVGAYALLGAAAMIGAGMQAPLAAVALVLELTHSGFALMVPIVVATVLATAVARWIDGYSIYTARLSAPARVDV
ncbi:voltage-gated chloride channel family protein [Jatrophihabitans fulvus]